jgi:hypothetical protein
MSQWLLFILNLNLEINNLFKVLFIDFGVFDLFKYLIPFLGGNATYEHTCDLYIKELKIFSFLKLYLLFLHPIWVII